MKFHFSADFDPPKTLVLNLSGTLIHTNYVVLTKFKGFSWILDGKRCRNHEKARIKDFPR